MTLQYSTQWDSLAHVVAFFDLRLRPPRWNDDRAQYLDYGGNTFLERCNAIGRALKRGDR